jgi:hypothetical protein
LQLVELVDPANGSGDLSRQNGDELELGVEALEHFGRIGILRHGTRRKLP